MLRRSWRALSWFSGALGVRRAESQGFAGLRDLGCKGLGFGHCMEDLQWFRGYPGKT